MAKKSNNTLFIILFIVGLALIGWGVNEYGLFGNKIVRTLGGGISDKVMILWIVGGVSALVGALGLLKK